MIAASRLQITKVFVELTERPAFGGIVRMRNLHCQRSLMCIFSLLFVHLLCSAVLVEKEGLEVALG